MLATYLILCILISLVLGEILVYLGICFNTQFQEPILLALSRRNSTLFVWIRILMFAIFVYWVYTSISILCSLRMFHGPINWSDGVALNLLILQSSLMGFSLFAWMVLDKLHPVIMENISVRKIIKAERKMLQERKLHMEDHRRVLQGKVAELTANMKKLKMDYQMKANKAQAEGAIVLELKNNFEEFRLKYDRLFDYNQTLRNQLQSISHEVQKIDVSNEWSNLKSKLGFPTVENNGKCVDFESASETATKYGEYPISATASSSSPRHRRPIYQF
ncbi:uncharacterized protein LOC107018872 [Solanum pennellii]|uniref:Endoplasmic reticulum transmembrane protein n=1 Tax=Solanum pennellii TaxID=28526 RepID=A0ABM1GRR9_SOLPN|nr:uncharacterized protein LOC107018872 [Solanum pennellii]